MDGEESKEPSQRSPFTRLEQVHSDFALAILIQEQEMASSRLWTAGSGNEEEEEEEEEASEASEDNHHDDANNQYFELELGSEESGTDEEIMEEGELDELYGDEYLDLDELSYEELLALGDSIGQEKTGLSIEEIASCLTPWKSCQPLDSTTSIDRCVICQVEYEEGEALVALPCEHPYHSECISKWLGIKKICPICSNEVSPPKLGRTS